MSNSNISEKQLAANRENAKKSTGPTSEEGKEVTRRNASRHHITGQVFTMTDEDRAAYDSRLEGLIADMKPQGALELTLVQSIAHCFWRLSRAEAMEENNFAVEAQRNENRIECINTQIAEALLQTMAFFENPHTFALLTLYEQRIHRRLHKDLKTLDERQARRPKIEKPARPSPEPIPQPKVKSATSGENGFVFSNPLPPSPEPPATAKIAPEPPDSAAERPKAA